MNDLLNVVERSKDNLLLAEDYIARESPARRAPTRPRPPPPEARAEAPQRLPPAACQVPTSWIPSPDASPGLVSPVNL